MEGIVQLSHSILDDALGLGDGALQQSKLLLQQLLLQLLLLARLHAQTHTVTTADERFDLQNEEITSCYFLLTF